MTDNRSFGVRMRQIMSGAGFGGASLLSSAAMAGTVAASLTVVSLGVVPAFRTSVVVAFASLGSIFTSTSSSTRPIIITPPPSEYSKPSITAPVAPTPTPSATPRPAAGRTSVGMNLSGPSYYGNERSFMNLLAGSRWFYISPANVWSTMPADRLNANRDVISIKTGESAARAIQAPNAVYQGKSVDIRCRWNGEGTIYFSPWVAKNPVVSSNSARFTWVSEGENLRPYLHVTKSNPSNPIRNLDCREADADPSLIFSSEYIAEISRYRVGRFMDWQNTNANLPVTWETRTTATSGEVIGDDGVALEYMVALVNQARIDPWFSIPWNGDDDYVRRFAEYVRDNVSPDLKIYVEVSNEVWNWVFKVTTQADNEGKQRGLSQATGAAMYMRYAEKTIQVMKIWEDVFKGQTGRLVRVAATQNAMPYYATKIFEFPQLSDHVDALAVAPYFALTAETEPTAATNLDDFFANVLPSRIEAAFKSTDQHRAIASQYGKRLIAYEAGQHLVTPDLAVAQRVQRDPRMGQMYTMYLNEWNRRYGDLIMLYQHITSISKYGAWGLQEYVGQPASQAPKYAATLEFIADMK